MSSYKLKMKSLLQVSAGNTVPVADAAYTKAMPCNGMSLP